MNMDKTASIALEKTASIALEMLEFAVLCVLREAKQSNPPGRVESGVISEQIGIPKSSEGSYSLVRHVLLRLKEEHKRYVANPAKGIWQITPEGESFLDTDF